MRFTIGAVARLRQPPRFREDTVTVTDLFLIKGVPCVRTIFPTGRELTWTEEELALACGMATQPAPAPIQRSEPGPAPTDF